MNMRTVFRSASTTCLLALGLAATASAGTPASRCGDGLLKGTYVFAATGFTRPAGSAPGTPWTPKAILEVLQFNGDGTLTTPSITLANPFGDSGAVLQPGAGAPGTYSVNDDCTGSVQFADPNGTAFKIYVDPPVGATVWMIQINPAGNVFQGNAKRVFY